MHLYVYKVSHCGKDEMKDSKNLWGHKIVWKRLPLPEKSQVGDVQGVNYQRRKLSGCNYLWAVFLGGNFPRGNCTRGNCPGFFSGGTIMMGAIILGGNCPGGNFPGANCLKWQFSLGFLISWWLSREQYSWGNCPGGVVLFSI